MIIYINAFILIGNTPSLYHCNGIFCGYFTEIRRMYYKVFKRCVYIVAFTRRGECRSLQRPKLTRIYTSFICCSHDPYSRPPPTLHKTARFSDGRSRGRSCWRLYYSPGKILLLYYIFKGDYVSTVDIMFK